MPIPTLRQIVSAGHHPTLRWLTYEADDGDRKAWAVSWIGCSQTVGWTCASSPWHGFNPIPRIVLLDWMRRWWFPAGIKEVLALHQELCGWRPVTIDFRGKRIPDVEPGTARTKRRYEIKADRRLARRMEGHRKRLQTLGPEGAEQMVAEAHDALRIKHHTQPKPPRWKVGDPWKEPFDRLEDDAGFR